VTFASVDSKNLKGDAQTTWAAHGLRLAEEVGRAIGGKVACVAFDCHMRSNPSPKSTAHVTRVVEHARAIRIKIKPKGSKYAFDVELRLTNGQDFPASAKRVIEAVECINTPPAQRDAKAVSGGKEKLEHLRSGIDFLLAAGADVKAAEEMRDDAQRRLTEKYTASDPAIYDADRLSDSLEAARAASEKARLEMDEAFAIYQAAKSKCEKLASEQDAISAQWKAADLLAAPLRMEVADLEAELEAAEQLLDEKAKAVQKSGDISALILALQKLN
jgi:hypothetical protein